MTLTDLRAALAEYQRRVPQAMIDERVAYLLKTFPANTGPIGTKNRARCIESVRDLRDLRAQDKPYGIAWTPKNTPPHEALTAAWITLALRTFEEKSS